jgi:outer membrane protein assembly factor BamE
MKPTETLHGFRRTLALLALVTLAWPLAGCVYRPDIQQGNLLLIDDVEQVKPGMTRSQVRYLLGTPMVSDPFVPDRWDYIYTFQRGRDRNVDRSHFVVHFEGDKVTRIEKRDLLEETEKAKIVRQQRQAKAGAAAVAPAAAAPAATGTAEPTPAPAAPPSDALPTDAPKPVPPPNGG